MMGLSALITASALAPRRARTSAASLLRMPLHGCLARLDQQLAVAVAADAEPEEVKAVVEVDDARLVLVEGQAPGCEPLREAVLDLLRLLGAGAHKATRSSAYLTTTGLPGTDFPASLRPSG